MRRTKNFMDRDVRPSSAGESDFALLLETHLVSRPVLAQNLPTARIRPNPFQARRNFEGIEELARAIRVLGFTTRLRVRRDPSQPGFFQLVFGERRLRAAEQAGLTEVPCDIAEHTDEELIEIGLAENIQRRDLDPLEEARAFQAFIEQRGYSNRRLAERIGKDKSYIEERLALLRTPEDVQQMVAQRPDTIRVAREIAKLDTPAERRPLIDGVVTGELSSRDVRAIVREAAMPPEQAHEERTQKTSSGDGRPEIAAQQVPAPHVGRTIERDIQLLRSVFGRWNQALPTLDSSHRARLLEYIEEHLTELERLTEALRDRPRPNRR